MTGILKLLLVFAAAAMLFRPFATLENSKLQTRHENQAKLQAAHGSSGFAAMLPGLIITKGNLILHSVPPTGALLAGAILVLPFGFSTYYTLRQRRGV
jgi:hypothetical protein